MSSIKITHQAELTAGSSLTLGELEGFVVECKDHGFSASSRVDVVRHDAIDQRDNSYTTITVRGA